MAQSQSDQPEDTLALHGKVKPGQQNVGAATPAGAAEHTVKRRETYERREDMSPTGRLRLFVEDDGDIILSVLNGSTMDDFVMAQVQFCSVGLGGGRSPHVRKALHELILAIQKDNADRPID